MVAAEVAKAVAAKAAAARDPVTSKPLPDESTIDPHKIDRPVLSAQGWVVPVTYGAAPAHLQRAPE
jgi:hypothetical protein